MTEFEAPAPNSSLGDRLSMESEICGGRVQAIENASDRAKKVVDQQGLEIEQIKI